MRGREERNRKETRNGADSGKGRRRTRRGVEEKFMGE